MAAAAGWERAKRWLLWIFVYLPLGVFVAAVVGINLFLFASEVWKLLTW